MVATAPKPTSIEDLQALPGDLRVELIEARLVEMSPAHKRHGVITRRMDRRLGRYVDEHPDAGDVWTGDAGSIVDEIPATVCVPDLAILTRDQVAFGEADDTPEDMPFVPTILMEITSPNNSEAEFARKRSLYLGAGAREGWRVRPAHRTITIHRPDGSIDVLRVGDALTSDALPGFRLELSDLLA